MLATRNRGNAMLFKGYLTVEQVAKQFRFIEYRVYYKIEK